MTGSVFCLLHLVNDGRVHTNLVVAFLLLISLVLSGQDFAWKKTSSIQRQLLLLNTQGGKKERYKVGISMIFFFFLVILFTLFPFSWDLV